jgi:hypothetical protein
MKKEDDETREEDVADGARRAWPERPGHLRDASQSVRLCTLRKSVGNGGSPC